MIYAEITTTKRQQDLARSQGHGGHDAVNPYQYQKTRIGEAVSILMSLRISIEERIAGAVNEFRRAFDDSMPSGEALFCHQRILQIMGHAPLRERIPTLTDAELSLLSEAFWELDRKIQRAYYEAEHGK